MPLPVRTSSAGKSQCLECGAGQAADSPVIEHGGPHPPVETDGRRVPVEHRPFETAAVPLDRHARHRRQQQPADAAAPRDRHHEEVFEVDPALREKRRVVVEEEREADRLLVLPSVSRAAPRRPDAAPNSVSARLFSVATT